MISKQNEMQWILGEKGAGHLVLKNKDGMLFI